MVWDLGRIMGRWWISIAVAPVLLGNNNPASEVTFDPVKPVATIVINGRSTVMEIAPDGPSTPVINAAVANELRLKRSMIGGLHMVGKTAVRASSNVARIDYGDGEPVRNRVFWFERDWGKIGEGRMGPGMVPQDVVTYRLRDPVDDERVLVFPMVDLGRAGLLTETTIQGEQVRVIFTFDRAEAMATASTGALLAAAYGGRLAGDPYNTNLELGFQRPVKRMEFDTPVQIGELQLRDVVVRTTDTGSTASIPDDQQDPSEIVVVAKGKKKPVHGIYVGTASLTACSSLTFDKPRREIRLSCR